MCIRDRLCTLRDLFIFAKIFCISELWGTLPRHRRSRPRMVSSRNEEDVEFDSTSEDYVKSTWIWRVLVSIWEKKRRRSFSVYLGSSAEFISMIFGSFGKFWIGLCVQKKILRNFFEIFWSTSHQFH